MIIRIKVGRLSQRASKQACYRASRKLPSQIQGKHLNIRQSWPGTFSPACHGPSCCTLGFVGLIHPLELALQSADVTAARQRKGDVQMCTCCCHHPVTFSTLLSMEPSAQGSWGRTIFYPKTLAKLPLTSCHSESSTQKTALAASSRLVLTNEQVFGGAHPLPASSSCQGGVVWPGLAKFPCQFTSLGHSFPGLFSCAQRQAYCLWLEGLTPRKPAFNRDRR
jgi:hypothetical protein